jgi:DNA/RNA endonuclease G (NUC1)
MLASVICLGIIYTYSFQLCFNETLKQSNYVQYTQEVHGSCDHKIKFKHDPLNSINTDEYTNNRAYDRGHLVPNEDYGCDTYIMGNVVPQLSSFNRGLWKTIEESLRNKYNAMTILKGGKYNGRTMQNDIQVPEGFYWVVLNGSELIDYNYIDQFTEEETKELPPWIVIKTNNFYSNQIKNKFVYQTKDKSIYPLYIIGGLLIFYIISYCSEVIYGELNKKIK